MSGTTYLQLKLDFLSKAGHNGLRAWHKYEDGLKALHSQHPGTAIPTHLHGTEDAASDVWNAQGQPLEGPDYERAILETYNWQMLLSLVDGSLGPIDHDKVAAWEFGVDFKEVQEHEDWEQACWDAMGSRYDET